MRKETGGYAGDDDPKVSEKHHIIMWFMVGLMTGIGVMAIIGMIVKISCG